MWASASFAAMPQNLDGLRRSRMSSPYNLVLVQIEPVGGDVLDTPRISHTAGDKPPPYTPAPTWQASPSGRGGTASAVTERANDITRALSVSLTADSSPKGGAGGESRTPTPAPALDRPFASPVQGEVGRRQAARRGCHLRGFRGNAANFPQTSAQPHIHHTFSQKNPCHRRRLVV